MDRKFLSAFQIRNDQDVTLDLAYLSPRMLRWHVEQSCRRLIERRVAHKVGLTAYSSDFPERRADIHFLKRQ